jgi:hypothetical protein
VRTTPTAIQAAAVAPLQCHDLDSELAAGPPARSLIEAVTTWAWPK